MHVIDADLELPVLELPVVDEFGGELDVAVLGNVVADGRVDAGVRVFEGECNLDIVASLL